MIKRILHFSLFLLFTPFLIAQNPTKKTLGHEELVSWNKINNPQISNDGNWVVYELKAEEGDATLKIYDVVKGKTTSIGRGENAKISEDNRYVLFVIKPPSDTLKMLRRQKVKKEDLPKNELGIYDLQNGSMEKIEEVATFKLPQKWAGWVVYQKEATEIEWSESKDSTKTKLKKEKPKKESKKNGAKLVIRKLTDKSETVFPYVVKYLLAEKGKKLVFQTTGNDSTFLNGIYLYDFDNEELQPLHRAKGDYKNLAFDEAGRQLAFLANFDTTSALVPPFELAYWKNGQDSAHIIAKNTASFLPEKWIISEHKKPQFSKDGSKLYFGITDPPILQDTSLLEEEIVDVEVWHWQDARLHTQQKVRQKQDEKKAYEIVWHPATNLFVALGNLDIPEISRGNEGNAPMVLGYNTQPYLKASSWEGFPPTRDLFLINTRTGTQKEVAKKIRGIANLSPAANYITSYIVTDSAWYSYEISTGKMMQLTDNQSRPFYDELNDRPMYPGSYGIAGWLEKDRSILINDRYDIWKVDPRGVEKAVNLTNGRADQLRYRYIKLDPEERAIKPDAELLLHIFDEKTKESGYALLDLGSGSLTTLLKGPYSFNRRPLKAKNADKIIFTKSNFELFPDLHYADLSFQNAKKISTANPQQAAYSWGTQELYEWTALDGQKLQGLLVKPEDFDPSKKYPMIVNFYERSSNGLYQHRAPSPGRSTINYPFYASRGYVIFNPDVPYRIGYPGESCYNAVVSGVTALINEGFIDKANIAVQGHSWGGYQIAYLLTKTDIFKCAESGAPVVNMFSAYGGIRWGSGLSRMFQYEHTQSRIGGTIWEYPLRYIENSPIFEMDKTNTPVLILHNDKDTAVPWYQGIEYFVALRRLGKPAWLLNYNGEPHWPVKLQNRKDFNIRLQQFFDYYLKNAPMPKWMRRGVSAIEKGKRQGLELIEK